MPPPDPQGAPAETAAPPNDQETDREPFDAKATKSQRERLLDFAWLYPYVLFIGVAIAGVVGGARCAAVAVASGAAVISVPAVLLLPRERWGARLSLAITGVGFATVAVLALTAWAPGEQRPSGTATQAVGRLPVARRPTLAWMTLPGVRLVEVNLEGADLRGARLPEADFSRSNLRRACLAGADLTGARVSDANFEGADLTGAVIDGVESEKAKHWPTLHDQRQSTACQ